MITDLPGFLTPIRIEGADAAEFLHGQFTTDVTGLAAGQAGLSAWCDPKGRVIATFILARLDDAFLLLLPGAVKEAFVKRLKMFVLRADVTIVDTSSTQPLQYYTGALVKDAQSLLPGLANIAPHSALRHNDYTLITYPADIAIILAGSRKTSLLRRAYETYFRDQGVRFLEKAFIRQDIPWLDAETSARFLPQELNLDTLEAVSFSKGCYPGQEIVARLRYRGAVKRRLCHATTDNKIRLEPGAALRPDGEERNIGTVVNSVISSKGQELLIVLERPFIESGKVVAEDFPDWSVESVTETTATG